jgi:hypothetical protein
LAAGYPLFLPVRLSDLLKEGFFDDRINLKDMVAIETGNGVRR